MFRGSTVHLYWLTKSKLHTAKPMSRGSATVELYWPAESKWQKPLTWIWIEWQKWNTAEKSWLDPYQHLLAEGSGMASLPRGWSCVSASPGTAFRASQWRAPGPLSAPETSHSLSHLVSHQSPTFHGATLTDGRLPSLSHLPRCDTITEWHSQLSDCPQSHIFHDVTQIVGSLPSLIDLPWCNTNSWQTALTLSTFKVYW